MTLQDQINYSLRRDLGKMKGVKKETIKIPGGELEIEKYSIGEGIYDKKELKIEKYTDGNTYYTVNYGNSSRQQMNKSKAIREFKGLVNQENAQST